METELGAGLSEAAIVAIVCNSIVAVLIFILFVILYKACKIPSSPEKAPVLAETQEPQRTEQKYLLTAAWNVNQCEHIHRGWRNILIVTLDDGPVYMWNEHVMYKF